MIKIIRTDSQNPDFRYLVELLDKVLKESDGDDHPFYAQYNKIENIHYTVVGYSEDEAAGCGAIKKYSGIVAEVKRMYVRPEFRGKGIAKKILSELELWAKELNFSECILETGKKQKDAVGLYLSSGYKIIPNYGQYNGMELSVCMSKIISAE